MISLLYLCLGRDFGMNLLDARTLRERWFLNPKDFNQVDAHLEGSIFLPGRPASLGEVELSEEGSQ